MREPKPFFRSQTQSWYVRLGKQFVPLGKDEAAAWDQYHELMAKRRQAPIRQAGSVARVLDDYWQWAQVNLAESTCDRLKVRIKSFGAFVGPKLTLQALRPHHVQAWLAELFPKASATYRYNLIKEIKRAMNWAVDMGYADVSPIARMKKPRPTIRQEFVPAELWPAVIEAATDEAFRDFLRVMLGCGCRVEEMFRAQAHNLDRKNRRLVFPIEDSKGKKRSRVIWLPDNIYAIVARLADEYPEGKLFRNKRGVPWDRNSVKCRFRRLKRILKMPRLTATTLRHSFAHHRLTSGQDSHVVSKLMGHVDGRMLETRYGHVDKNPEFMRDQVNRIASPLADPVPPEGTGQGLSA